MIPVESTATTGVAEDRVPTLTYFLAAILSTILPGLGQLAKRHVRKGSSLLAATAICVSSQWTFRLPFTFWGLSIISVVTVFLVFYSSLDAFVSRLRPDARRPSLWFLLLVVPLTLVICHFEIGGLWRAQGVRHFNVPSTSMEPVIHVNESMVADATYYRHHAPRRGDVIVFRRDGLFIVKRVIAVAGDSIEGTSDGIVLNGKLIPSTATEDPTFLFEQVTIPERKLFVAGDNRAVSLDSRVAGYGLVSFDDLVGKALFITRSKNPERSGTEIR